MTFVVVRATESAGERQIIGDKQGGFRIDDLLPGLYLVTVRATGFADAKSEVAVAVSSLREVTVTLQRATQATVTVTGRSSSISTEPLHHDALTEGQRCAQSRRRSRSKNAGICHLASGDEI